MTQPPVLRVDDATRDRQIVTVGTPRYGQARVVLMPGVLGTDDGDQVLRRASDPSGATALERRRGKPRKAK